MEQVAIDGTGKGTDQVQVFFQAVEDRLDLGSPVEEDLLPGGDDLLFLTGPRRRDHDQIRGCLSYLLEHHRCAVQRVSDDKVRAMIDQFGQDLRVVFRCGREVELAQFSPQIRGEMQLESEVPALVIFPEGSHIPGNFVMIGTVEFTDFQHGGIDEADGGIDA